MSDIRDHDGTWPATGIDYGDTIVHVCHCGNSVFQIFATFDDYQMASYSTDGECVECHSRFKVPTPVDRPGYKPDSLAF